MSESIWHPDEQADAVVVVDDDRRFVDANLAALTLIGVSKDALLTQRIEDLAPDDTRSQIDAMWLRLLSEGRLTGTVVVQLPLLGEVTLEFAALANFPVPGLHFGRVRPLVTHAE